MTMSAGKCKVCRAGQTRVDTVVLSPKSVRQADRLGTQKRVDVAWSPNSFHSGKPQFGLFRPSTD